jgi:pullulanase
VPGFYHRRDNVSGGVVRNSCCDDTASEFRMMEKLMIDTGVSWARDYKVSGFRFDLMSFHPLASMERFRDAVQAVEPTIYIYGEGWNFGVIQDDARFKTARQANLGGTGIGSFSDRIRDPIKGGGCCDGGDALVNNQGFVNGWWYDPNSANTGSTADRRALISSTDNIRVWLAGGLADFQLQNAAGNTVTGSAIVYSGQPGSGYTQDPQEAINYVEKHDNQTLWDFGAYRHPDSTSLADRVRAHNVGLSLILLGQGVPFLHAGSDILRSKSGDRDSYDSGDWFNELDWTLSGTKWAQGLPVADKNESVWPILEGKYQTVPRPDSAAQQRASDHFREMLRIRKSSQLFRLRDAASIKQRVKFYNTGPNQIGGLIAMGIEGCTNPGEPAPDKGAYMVVFNANDEPQTVNLFGTEAWTLHPVLAASTDSVVKTAKHDANGFYVPARTTAVFERTDQRSCSPFPVDMFVRGSFNDWAAPPPAAYRLQFQGGTKYLLSGAAVTLPTGGLPKFKIADANWVAATNCGGTAANQTVLLGQPFTMKCGDGTPDVALNATVAGNYSFSLDATSTVNPVLTVTRTSPSKDLTAYVRGGFNGWGLATPMTWDGEGAYTAIVNRTDAGATNFKIATEDWSTLDCGGATGGTSVTIGQPYALKCGSGTSDIGVNFPAAGNYAFVVDGTDQSALTVTVEPFVDVYIRGGFNGWGIDDKMLYRGKNRFRLDRAFSGATNFKIASEDWAAVDCGAASGGQQVTIGTPFAMACGGGTSDVALPTGTGTYRFDFTHQRGTSTAEVLVTGP